MKPAERLAALKAIKYGVDAALANAGLDEAIAEAQQAVNAAMDDSGADRYRTPLGPVVRAVRADKIIFNEDALLRFANQHPDLDAVETHVRPTFRTLFVADGDQVVFTPTGETVDWATVHPGGTYLTTRLDKHARQRATELMQNRVGALLNEQTIEQLAIEEE